MKKVIAGKPVILAIGDRTPSDAGVIGIDKALPNSDKTVVHIASPVLPPSSQLKGFIKQSDHAKTQPYIIRLMAEMLKENPISDVVFFNGQIPGKGVNMRKYYRYMKKRRKLELRQKMMDKLKATYLQCKSVYKGVCKKEGIISKNKDNPLYQRYKYLKRKYNRELAYDKKHKIVYDWR